MNFDTFFPKQTLEFSVKWEHQHRKKPFFPKKEKEKKNEYPYRM